MPQAAAGYAIVAWILLQVGEVTFEPLHLPDWALTALVVAVIAGFPVAIALAWFFDIGLTGIRKTPEAGAEPGAIPTMSPTDRQPETPSVAVLAFDDMSPAKDQEYLCDGIAEEILNRLAQIDKLRVASRTSSFRFKGAPQDASRIGREIGVSSVLEGSVRKAGDRLRVTTQLINVADGFHLWSHSYDKELEDIFAIQDEIAASVAEALAVRLTGSIVEDGGTRDVVAYEFYLRGLHYFHRWGLRNVRFAIDMFTRAVERDGEYARAWAALADAHAMVCMYWQAEDAHLDGSDSASKRALSIAPELAEAHVSCGLAHVIHGRPEAAAAEFEAALKLDPELFAASYFYGRVCFQQGNLEKAAALFEQAARIHPDDFQAPILLRQVYRSLGRDDDAMASARKGTLLAQQHLDLNPDDTRALNLGLGGLADLNEREKLMEWAARSLALDGDNPDTLYNVSCGYARIGEKELALDCLDRAALRGSAIAEWAEHDSDLDGLRDDERFKSIIARMRRSGPARG